MDFDDEFPALNHRRAANGPTGEVKMKRSHYVNPISIFEHSEIRAYARIEVNELVSTVSRIVAIVNVDNARIVNEVEQLFRLADKRVILHRNTQGGRTCKRRIGAQLFTRESH